MTSNVLASFGQGALIIIAKELTVRDFQAVFCCDKWLNNRENNPHIWASIDGALVILEEKREKRRRLEKKIKEHNLGAKIKAAPQMRYTFISSISRSLAFQHRLVAWWIRKLDLREATLFLLCNASHNFEAVDPITRAVMELERVCGRRGVTIHRSLYETLEERADVGDGILMSKRSAVAMIGFWRTNKKPSTEFKRYLERHKIPILFNHVSVPIMQTIRGRIAWYDERAMIERKYDESLSSMIAVQRFLTPKEIVGDGNPIVNLSSRYMSQEEAKISMGVLRGPFYEGSAVMGGEMLIGDGVFLSSFSSAPVEILPFEQINDELGWF